MAFSSRARRPGAFSAGAAAAKAPSPEAAFAGPWVDDDGTIVNVENSKLIGPDGSVLPLTIKSETSVSFVMQGETFDGTLASDGRLKWSDGCVWTRKGDAPASASKESPEERARLQAEAEAKAEEEVRLRKIEESKKQREEQRQKAMEEARRKAAAIAEERRQMEEAQAQVESKEPEAAADAREAPRASEEAEAFAAAKAKAQAGIDRAKAAFEAEKARKAAALERARAAKAAEEAADEPAGADSKDAAATATAKAQSQTGLDKARQAYEAEKARKAAAAERVKKEKEDAAAAAASGAPEDSASAGVEAAAKAQSQAGIDRARQAYEAEKARKAAALERARAAKAAAEDATAADAKPEPTTAVEAKAKSQAGIDRAKAAFEAEKARKAAALERVRAEKAAMEAKAEAEAAQPEAASDPVAAAKAKSMSGIDKAKAAFEAEKARKAAALERVRSEKAAAEAAAKAESEASAATAPAKPEVDPVAAAKARSQAGLDKAKAAFEAEKARKAAALEKARAAKAAAEAEAAETLQDREAAPKPSRARPSAFEKAMEQPREEAVPKSGRSRPSAFEKAMGQPQEEAVPKSGRSRPSAFEQSMAQPQAAPASKRPSAFEAAQAKASASSEPVGKRPSAFEAAQAKASGSKDFAAEAFEADASARGAQSTFAPGVVVRLHDLVARSDLNGLLGELLEFKEDTQRWEVAVEGMGDTHCNLKEQNMTLITQEEFDSWQAEQEQMAAEMQAQDIDVEKMVKSVSGEAMRWTDTMTGKITRAPGPMGNVTDISLRHSRHGAQITECLSKRGVCMCEANAGYDLIMAAYDEAKSLWDQGQFQHPMQDMGASELEAALWERVLYQDEKKVLWINEMSDKAPRMEALTVLANNMKDFASTIQEPLKQRMGINWSHLWDGMVACYSGRQTYNFHLDNPHSLEENSLPDNGLRLSLVFYINPHWSPETDYNGGGLDVFLTPPEQPPASAAAARRAERMRIAPHADTLAVFLSQRMAHQVIPTKGDKGEDPWFCIWLWCFEEEAMSSFPAKVLEQRGLVQPSAQTTQDMNMDELDDDGSDVVPLDQEEDELSEID